MATPEERVAQRMKAARKRAGISQEEAGRRLGVTLRTYARWERAETHGFLAHIDHIAKALETTTDGLLGGDLRPTARTVEEMSEKIDQVLDELRKLIEDLGQDRPKRQATRKVA